MAKHRILAVDDDENWLKLIQKMLGRHYDLSLTRLHTEAVSLVKSSHFSLAILDQRLPGGPSGVELFQQLRAIRHDLRAIILTGHAHVKDAVASLKSGACDYISKGERNLRAELPRRIATALEEQMTELIAKPEGAEVERKASMRWDFKEKRANKALEEMVVRTVAGFLNSESGGVLLIGVDDDGTVVGLQHDYQTLPRKDRDGFESFLTGLLLGAYGKDVSPLIHVGFHAVNGHEVCRVSAKPAPRAVLVPDGHGVEHLYLRTGNSTRQLSMREALEYSKGRWKQ